MFCYLVCLIFVIGCIGDVAELLRGFADNFKAMDENALLCPAYYFEVPPWHYGVAKSIDVATSIFATFIFYNYCATCNAWWGLLYVFIIAVLSHMITSQIAPSKCNPQAYQFQLNWLETMKEMQKKAKAKMDAGRCD